ncbi:MAG: hypothetical protein R3D59_16930 [Paracoccaceae bacterium]
MNYGRVILDVARVTIGDRVQIGPYVQRSTADHPRDAAERATGAEWGRPRSSTPGRRRRDPAARRHHRRRRHRRRRRGGHPRRRSG